MPLNGYFAANMTDKTVKFDVQPYERGTGIIRKITERRIKTTKFDSECGDMVVEYDTFDLTIEISEGSATGALWGGVPVAGTVKDRAGTTTHIMGVSAGQLRRAVNDGQTIVIARCG